MKKRSFPVFILPVVFILLIIGDFLLSGSAPAVSVKQPIVKGRDSVLSHILSWPENSFDHAVLVDKSEQKVLVYRRDNLYEPEKVYRCSTGENDGPKWKKNDRKTPEGIYFFTGSFLQNELAPIYGIMAFPLNYPNDLDKREGKGGHGIWFHGTNKALKPRDSNGCIALENKDIEDLAKYIKINKTPVIIGQKIKLVAPAEINRESLGLKELIEHWRSSWEKDDIDNYISFYHRDFCGGGKNIRQWKEYKERLAGQYKRLSIKIEDLQVFKHEGVVMARFLQRYNSGSFDSHGIKTLYFKKNSNRWRIFGEYFEGIMESTLLAKKEDAFSDKGIFDFINYWIDAWEKKDLDKYIMCYDKGFESRGMKLGAWKIHRHKLNMKYKTLKVKITDLKILEKSGDRATVFFTQDYRADEYRDLGTKEILLVNEGGRWKIKKEEWNPMGG